MKQKRRICMLLCLALLAAGCSGQEQNTPGEEKTASYEIWSAPSTVKIRQDLDYEQQDKGEAKVDITMCRNEYESAQIIIEAETAIERYTVAVSDLVSETGDRIPAENVTVYNQKYVETKTRSNTVFPTGIYPDALLPFEAAEESGENHVEAGNNQGIWIEVETDMTPAGEYSGSLTLTVDEDIQNIPIHVKVWDFMISKESHSRTAYNIYVDDLAQGEGDSSDAMLEKYYELFLNHRINLMKLPAKGNDTENYVAAVKKYHDDERVNTYILPGFWNQPATDTPGTKVAEDYYPNMERMTKLISRLVYESVKDGKNYFSKAVFYDITTDEYSQGTEEKQAYSANRYRAFRNTMGRIVKDYDEAYGPNYIDQVPGLRDSVAWLPEIAVAEYVQGINEYVNIWCPPFQSISKADTLKKNRNLLFSADATAQMKNKELWWYGCVSPVYPYPTYHVDDVLYSSRLMRWMQYDYEITGDLYWNVTTNSPAANGVDNSAENPYDSANRYEENNGDGFLVYPGTYYGIDGPVGSIRLKSIRDGQEEYEYFYLLDSMCRELSTYYEVPDVSYRKMCQEIFDSLYSEGKFKTNLDVSLIQENREKIAGLIANVSSTEKLIVEKEETEGTKMTLTLLASKETTLAPNDYYVRQESAGQGTRYIYEIDLDTDERIDFTVVYTVGGEEKSYTRQIVRGKQTLAAMDQESDLEMVYVDGEKSIGSIDGTSAAKLIVNTDLTTEAYQPEIDIFAESFGSSISTDGLEVQIYLAGRARAEVQLKYVTSVAENMLDTVTLAEGWNIIKIDLSGIDLSQVKRFAFQFRNEGDSYEIYMGRIKYYEK